MQTVPPLIDLSLDRHQPPYGEHLPERPNSPTSRCFANYSGTAKAIERIGNTAAEETAQPREVTGPDCRQEVRHSHIDVREVGPGVSPAVCRGYVPVYRHDIGKPRLDLRLKKNRQGLPPRRWRQT